MNLNEWVSNPQKRGTIYATLGILALITLFIPGAILHLPVRIAIMLVITVVGAGFTELCGQHDGTVPAYGDIINANLTFNGIVSGALLLWYGFTSGMWAAAAIIAVFVTVAFTAADVVPRWVVRRFVK